MVQLTFEQAVDRVRRDKGAAFGFLPKTREGTNATNVKSIGGSLYVIEHCADHADEPDEYPEYFVHYVGGLYNSTSLESEAYWPSEVPLEARNLLYRFVPTFDSSILEYELQLIRQELDRLAERP